MVAPSPAAPHCDEQGAWLAVPDTERRYTAVDLVPDVWSRRPEPFGYDASSGVWRLHFRRPEADRVEYLLRMRSRDGSERMGPDPANPDTAEGPFGDKSVLTFPGYRCPGWLDAAAPAGTCDDLEVATREHVVQPVRVWSSEGTRRGAAAPLLLIHDGPELDALSAVTRYLATQVAEGALPPLRAALLPPGPERDERYSANPVYAEGLVHDVLPVVQEEAPATVRLLLGASLGGLAALHAAWRSPGVFAGLFLQSGSFFDPALDGHEAPRFAPFGRVTQTVAEIDRLGWAEPLPVTLTCGLAEENLGNNRRMAQSLRRSGLPVQLAEVRDAHTFVGWRDSLDPFLRELVRSALGAT